MVVITEKQAYLWRARPTRSGMMNGHDLKKAFWRNEDGSWICIDPITIDHPQGRIQIAPGTLLVPGQIFMGVDVAAWLEEQV